jgi:hypothetical protein
MMWRFGGFGRATNFNPDFAAFSIAGRSIITRLSICLGARGRDA